MTYCRHCRRNRSLDDHIPAHMLFLAVFLALLLWLVSYGPARDCGQEPVPAGSTSWPPALEISPSADAPPMRDTHRMRMHGAYGLWPHDIRP